VHAARSAALPRTLTLRRRMGPRGRRGLLKALAIALVVAVALAGGWLWLRDSPLVSVDHVRVVGVHGPGASGIRDALKRTASDMTTLDLDEATLRNAVAPFAAVKSIAIHSHPPHSITIDVRMNVAVAALVFGSASSPVGDDGVLLSGVSTLHVPDITVGAPQGGRYATGTGVRSEIAVAATAPEPLRRHIATVFRGPRGLGARLRNGPLLYFGSRQRLIAKWAAIARVLADPAAAGAAYLDASVPERVAAGGLEPTGTLNQ
jgi:cell division protein FtsQ